MIGNYYRSKAIAFVVFFVPALIWILYTSNQKQPKAIKTEKLTGIVTHIIHRKKFDFYDTDIRLKSGEKIHLKIGTKPPPERNKTIPLLKVFFDDGQFKYDLNRLKWQNEGPQSPQ